jgi:hypothetical protein
VAQFVPEDRQAVEVRERRDEDLEIAEPARRGDEGDLPAQTRIVERPEVDVDDDVGGFELVDQLVKGRRPRDPCGDEGLQGRGRRANVGRRGSRRLRRRPDCEQENGDGEVDGSRHAGLQSKMQSGRVRAPRRARARFLAVFR